MRARASRRRLLAAAGACALVGAAGPWLRAPAAAQEPLKLAFIPQENPEKLLDDITVIDDWLSARLGVPVEGFVTLDHAAAVEALRGKSADISFMGALPYVLAHDQIGAEVLLSEVYRGKASYVARIFVRRDSGIASVADLAGKTIAFADPISESGYLYPLEIVADAGLLTPGADPQSFFERVYFAGGYQQAIQAVANGLVDAAGVSQFADLLLTPEQQSQVRWIAESKPIPSHAVIARPGLDPALKERFVAAMLELNEPANRWLLKHVYGPDGYVRADQAAYEPVAEVARRYGLLG
jgi:phosphonate transport system substrate-binding protein